MVGDLLKRLVNGVVFLVAALCFFVVPIGRKTGAQHLVAICSTPPAREAASAFATVARQASSRALAELDKLRNPPALPRAPRPPSPRGKPPS